ncbi:MAG: hypothetical protein QXY50_02855 [Candidatus Caldarchaeum sp.]
MIQAVVLFLAAAVIAVDVYIFYTAYAVLGFPEMLYNVYVLAGLATAVAAVIVSAYYGLRPVGEDEDEEDVDAEDAARFWEMIEREKPQPQRETGSMETDALPPVGELMQVNGHQPQSSSSLSLVLENALANALSTAAVKSELGIHLDIDRKRIKLGELEGEIYGSMVFRSDGERVEDRENRQRQAPPSLPDKSLRNLLEEELARLSGED